MLEGGITGRIGLESGAFVGGYLNYEHRLTDGISVYAKAELGWVPITNELAATASVGGRIRF